MGMPLKQAVVSRAQESTSYERAFKRVFGDNVTISMHLITQAAASYERTLITPDTPYDRFE